MDQLVDWIIKYGNPANEPPAIVDTPWLWPIVGVLFLAGVLVDRRVHWEQQRRFQVGDVILAAALAAAVFLSAVVSLATRATFPAGDSLLWPLVGFAVMTGGLAVRVRATGLLGADFNAALRTRAGQTVIDVGPYRWVRHPGYLGVWLYLIGLPVITGWWPPVVVMAVVQGVASRNRIRREEAINRVGIVGYREYMARVRWRMVPGVW